MKRLPLYFTRTYGLEGEMPSKGVKVLIRIQISGRFVLLDDESGELGARYWISGVNPGGAVGEGATEPEAREAFHDAVGCTLAQLAVASKSQEEFEASVRKFVRQADVAELRSWRALRDEVRAWKLSADESLPREKAERQNRVSIKVFYWAANIAKLKKLATNVVEFPRKFRVDSYSSQDAIACNQ